jgi:hypothetical protein
MDFKSEIIEAKYHLSIVKRMLKLYEEYPEKRVLIGIINESAKCAGKLVRSFLIFKKTKGNLETFTKYIAPQYLKQNTIENIIKMLEVQSAQKNSPIEFYKKDKIIFLIENEYRTLTIKRLKEFISSIEESIYTFENICRQV